MNSEIKLNDLNPEIDEEFSNFLLKVEEVESILKKMNSVDPLERQKGFETAQKAVHGNEIGEINDNAVRTKCNRTVINRDAVRDSNLDNQGQEMPKDQFMRYVEKDAQQRARDRKERKEASSKHMKEGILAFRNQEYEKALFYFDKAIELVRDNPVLYCNRALTYIKLQIPSKALGDAEWALKLDEKSLKGHVYKAQSLFCMGNKKESQEAIDEACKQLESKEDFLKGLYDKWTHEEAQ